MQVIFINCSKSQKCDSFYQLISHKTDFHCYTLWSPGRGTGSVNAIERLHIFWVHLLQDHSYGLVFHFSMIPGCVCGEQSNILCVCLSVILTCLTSAVYSIRIVGMLCLFEQKLRWPECRPCWHWRRESS